MGPVAVRTIVPFASTPDASGSEIGRAPSSDAARQQPLPPGNGQHTAGRPRAALENLRSRLHDPGFGSAMPVYHRYAETQSLPPAARRLFPPYSVYGERQKFGGSKANSPRAIDEA